MHYPTDQRPAILQLCIELGGPSPVSSVKCPGVWDLVEIFSPFGCLRKIAIFSQTPSTKAFLEFSLLEEALLAKEFAHESSINDFGCARLLLSDRHHLDSSTEFLDYLDLNISVFPKSLDRPSTGSNYPVECRSPPYTQDIMMRSFSLQLAHSSEAISLTNEFAVHPVGQIMNHPLTMSSDPSLSRPQTLGLGAKFQVQALPSQFIIRPSKVVLASNLDNFFDSAIQLFNLFSCFGNLTTILLMKNRQKAMLQYTSLSGSQNCIDYFTEHPLEEMLLRVKFSKYAKIDLKKRNKSENFQHYYDVLIVPPECNRFPANEAVPRPLLPSTALLVLVEIQEGDSLSNAFSVAIHAIRNLGVEPIQARNEMRKYQHPRLRVTLPSLRDSLLIISKLHRARIDQFVLSVLFYM